MCQKSCESQVQYLRKSSVACRLVWSGMIQFVLGCLWQKALLLWTKIVRSPVHFVKTTNHWTCTVLSYENLSTEIFRNQTFALFGWHYWLIQNTLSNNKKNDDQYNHIGWTDHHFLHALTCHSLCFNLKQHWVAHSVKIQVMGWHENNTLLEK